MSKWQQLWRHERAERLWEVPDPSIVGLAEGWKARGDVCRVLDLGCGVGRHVAHLAREGFEVYGLDRSPAAIEKSRERLAEAGLRAELVCGEMGSLPYPDGHFDAVIAFNSVYHGTGDEVGRTIRRLAAKLRPGGLCFATLPSRENRMYGKGTEIAPHTFLSPGVFGGLFEGDGERGVPHYFFSEEDLPVFFRDFAIDSLYHEELTLVPAVSGRRPLRIPAAYFWRLLARKQ